MKETIERKVNSFSNNSDVWKVTKTYTCWRVNFNCSSIKWQNEYPSSLMIKDILQAEQHLIKNVIKIFKSSNKNSERFLKTTLKYINNELKNL